MGKRDFIAFDLLPKFSGFFPANFVGKDSRCFFPSLVRVDFLPLFEANIVIFRRICNIQEKLFIQ